jgi:hypothetical protein
MPTSGLQSSPPRLRLNVLFIFVFYLYITSLSAFFDLDLYIFILPPCRRFLILFGFVFLCHSFQLYYLLFADFSSCLSWSFCVIASSSMLFFERNLPLPFPFLLSAPETTCAALGVAVYLIFSNFLGPDATCAALGVAVYLIVFFAYFKKKKHQIFNNNNNNNISQYTPKRL